MYIRSRESWGAVPANGSYTHDRWSEGVTLVLHHTAGANPKTLTAAQAECRSIQRQHMAGSRGEPFIDIGYNILISWLGFIFEGRPFGVRGAHTKLKNSRTIGISLMGNLDRKRPSVMQRRALVWTIKRLQARGAKIVAVKGHREMPNQATACPGRYGMPLVEVARRAAGIS